MAHWSGIRSATFTTAGHELHRLRRAALSSSFAKRRIYEISPLVQQYVDKACSRLKDDFVGKQRVLTLDDLFTCFTADVIMDVFFAKTYGFLDTPKFQSPFAEAMQGFKSMAHLSNQFPLIPWFAALLPGSVVSFLQPSLGAVHSFQQVRSTSGWRARTKLTVSRR